MSKNNRSLDELEQNLNTDFIARRDELYYLKKLLDKNSKSKEGKYIAKTLIVTLYAHWEGFIKYSSDCLIQFTSHQKIKANKLSLGFFAISNLMQLQNFTEANVALKIKALELIFENREKYSKIPYNYSISTYSNLKTEVLEEICMVLGIDESDFSMKKGIIDKKLLDVRNQIAHGNLVRYEVDDCIETYELVMPILEYFKACVLNRAIEISNLRQS